MIRIAICDDSESHGKKIEGITSSFLAESKLIAQISFYELSQNLYYDIAEGMHFDLLLSDIQMPNMDGMELAKNIKAHLPDIMIIFITDYKKYAIDSFKLDVFRFIPKTMLDKELPEALAAAVGIIQKQQDQYYTIQTSARYEKIPLKQIICVHKEGKNALITQLNNQTAKVRKSLAAVLSELGSDDFMFVGRSDIVNIVYIMSLKNGVLELENGERMPVSPSALNEIKERLTEFWGKKI